MDPQLDGIIAHLTRECGGNVHDKGTIKVTASSVNDSHSCYEARNAADLGTDSEFRSADRENSWIRYDFKERRVIPTSYSVRSFGFGPGYSHPKSWVIEVSRDGTESSWMEIDRRDNTARLNDKFVTANFTISHVPSEGFRFFRLRQTGSNHFGNCSLFISSLEIFGRLYEK